MCGIVGYIRTHNQIFEKASRGFLKYALILDTLRGPDSTGVITVENKFTVKRAKATGPGLTFVSDPRFDEISNGWCTIGHNRAATIGKVTPQNAHPFKFGKVSLVHNGTVRDDGVGLVGFDAKLEVDSMIIARSLSMVKPSEAKSVLEGIDGDYCLVWVDERDRSINMARNRGRPMHLGMNHNRNLMFFMSDGDHLEVLTKAFRNTTASMSTIYEIDPHKHFKWKRGSLEPQVSSFRPFVRAAQSYNLWPHERQPKAQSNKSTSGTKDKKSTSQQPTANERAEQAWKRATERSKKQGSSTSKGVNIDDGTATKRRGTSGTGSPINRNVAASKGTPRTNTDVQKDTLADFFKLNGFEAMEFVPEDFYDVDHGMYQVVGKVHLTHWEGCEWEATINFVEKKQADAYADHNWLVKPIGTTRNRSIQNVPAILVDLIHCNYDKYRKEQEPETDDKEDDSLRLVQDPDLKLIPLVKLQKMMDRGCIQCGDAIDEEDLTGCEYVNENRDLLCEGCVWENLWPLAVD